MIDSDKPASPVKRFLMVHGIISLILLSGGILFFGRHGGAPPQEMKSAFEIMDSSLRVISGYCRDNNININTDTDPRNTGLIGPEWSEITTTAGDITAKRTTINPNFAALIVNFLMEAKVKTGDTVAIACSGSFPALMIAAMSAARAMDLHARVILSVGASSHGASDFRFTILEIYQLLLEKGLISTGPSGCSLGGEFDNGGGFDPDVKAELESRIKANGWRLILEKELAANVNIRNRIYSDNIPGAVKAFISTGGSYSSLGSSSLVLELKPGLIHGARMPGKEHQGMIHSMLGQGVPVIHLLFIRGLAQKYHLAWDPATTPAFSSRYHTAGKSLSPAILVLCLLMLGYFIFILSRINMLQNRI